MKAISIRALEFSARASVPLGIVALVVFLVVVGCSKEAGQARNADSTVMAESGETAAGGGSATSEGNALPSEKTGSTARKPDLAAAIEIPAIEKKPSSCVVAYRVDGHRFLESEGWNTEVYRFSTWPNGYMGGATVSRRGLYGEREVSWYSTAPLGSETLVTGAALNEYGGKSDDEARFTYRVDGESVEVSGGGGLARYTRAADGSLKIEKDPGGYSIEEEWSADGSSRILRNGELIASGRVVVEGPGRYRYLQRRVTDPEGHDELEYDIWEKGDRLDLSVGSVEPLATMYIEGLFALLSGGRTLENLAFVDRVLGLDRRLSPILAIASARAAKAATEGK